MPKTTDRKPARKVISIIPGHARITVLAGQNPYKPGTVAFRTFELLRTGMTAEQFRLECRKRKADLGYLPVEVAAGRIHVSK
jgi:hypothetical protein